MKLPTIYEQLNTIIEIDLDTELPLIITRNSLERDLVGHNIFEDADA